MWSETLKCVLHMDKCVILQQAAVLLYCGQWWGLNSVIMLCVFLYIYYYYAVYLFLIFIFLFYFPAIPVLAHLWHAKDAGLEIISKKKNRKATNHFRSKSSCPWIVHKSFFSCEQIALPHKVFSHCNIYQTFHNIIFMCNIYI